MTFAEAVELLDLTHPVTGERITPEDLLETLKEDVVLCVERPGSWEGSNMSEVLYCHGFLGGDGYD